MELTQSILKSRLHYEPETGIFTWLVNHHSVKAATVAGSANGNGYIHIGVSGKNTQAHRLAFLYMTGEFPPDEIDHINGARNDNRWSNLRPVSRAENNKNSKRRHDNTSGVTGVSWCKTRKRWAAHIQVDGKPVNLGRFTDFFEAVSARKLAERKYNFHPNHGRSA